jgi:WD40 repeat protein
MFPIQAQDLPEHFVAYSPDGTLLAVQEKGTIRILDRYSDIVLNELPTLTWGRYIAAPKWSPAGNLLAIENGPELQIWANLNVPEGRQLHALFQADDRIYSLTWNPNGQEIATSAHTIQIHNLVSGFTRTLSEFKGVLWDIAWSPDGTLIASGGEDNTATLWNVATGGIVQEMTLIRDMNFAASDVFLDATAVAWSPDGTRLVVGGEDGSLRLWDLAKETDPEFGTSQGSSGVVLAHPWGSVVSAAWSPNGEMIASSSLVGSVAVQDARDLHSIAFFDTGASTSVSWNPVSGNLVIANEENPLQEVIVMAPSPEPTSTSTPLPTDTPTLTPPPTLTPTPAATATPAPFQRLRLTSLCSANPAAYRLWRIRNSNPVDVVFTWDVYRSPTGQNGFGVAPPAVNGVASEVIISTVAEAGADTLRLFVDGAQQDVKASSGAACPTPTPTP